MNQRRVIGVVAGLVLLAIAVIVGLWRSGSHADRTEPGRGSTVAGSAARPIGGRAGAAGSKLTIVVRDTGSPLAGALVVARAEHRDPRIERTNPAGTVELADLPADTWTITASAAGHLAAARDVTISGGSSQLELTLAPGGAMLRGTITDGRGGPVAGARVDAVRLTRGVTLGDSVTASALADDQGRYEVIVAAASYHVEVSHEAYAPIGRRVDVSLAGATADFTVLPGGAIEGRVVGEDDKPIAGALVIAEGGSNDARSVLADADGKFRVTGLPPATISLEASAPGWLSDDPVDVRLAVGEEVTDVVLRLAHVARVSGSVVTAAGAPVPAVKVSLLGPRYRELDHVTSAADGTFGFEAVAAGKYQLTSAPSGWTSGATAIDVQAVDLTGLRVVRGVAPTIKGRVDPPKVAEIWLQPVLDGPAILVGAPKQTAPDGTFELTAPDVGKMRIAARGSDGEQGTADIEVKPPGVDQIVVPLRPGAVLAGRVVDEAGTTVPGVAVMALPITSSRMTTVVRGGVTDGRQAPTGADGTFRLQGLQAGQYELRVLDQGHALTKPDGKALAVDVDLADAQQKDVTIVCAPARRVIRGIVKRGDGTPVADAWVRATQSPWRIFQELSDGAIRMRVSGRSSSGISIDDRDGDRVTMASPTLTGPDGRFELRGLRAVEVDIVVEADRGNLRGHAKATPDADLMITVGAPGSLAGKVTLGGAPVAAFEIELNGPSGIERAFRDPAGHYQFARLEAGDYTATARSDAGEAEGKVTVTAGASANLDIALAAHGKVIGKVVDESGQPVAGAEMNPNLVLEDGGSTMGLRGPLPITRADGSFEMYVAPGKIRVYTQLKGKTANVPELDVASGATVDAGTITVQPLPAK